jgi:ribokinase
MARRIAVVGSNMTDLVTSIIRMPAPGETLEAPAFAMGFAARAPIQAVAAARLGAEVMMVTKVGDDVFGQSTIDNLRTTAWISAMSARWQDSRAALLQFLSMSQGRIRS